MKRAKCRLSVADKFFGGGGGSGTGSALEGRGVPSTGSIMFRDPQYEQKEIGKFNLWDFIGPKSQLGKFTRNEPLLSRGETGAAGFWDQLGSLLGPMQKSFGALPGATGISDLESAYQRNVAPTIASGGALSAEGAREASQLARLNPGGSLRDVGAVVREAQGRESARTQRLNTALGQAGTFRGLEQGIAGGQTQAASGIQGVQTGALNQLLGVEAGKIGAYTAVANPVKSFLANLFSGNQQASVAGSQISAQRGIASDANKSALIGSGIKAAGSIAGAAAMSDERIKTKIRRTKQKTGEGIPIKTWEYITRPGVRFSGPMAQDVLKKRPDAVVIDPLSRLLMVKAEFTPKMIEKGR